jgi:dephospho-CoA kinase
VHPQVGAEFARRLAAAIEATAPLIVLDIPLPLRGPRRRARGSAASRNVETTVVVWGRSRCRSKRHVARDGCTREDAIQRDRAQLPLDRKRELADHVIETAGRSPTPSARWRALYEKLTAAGA